MKLKDNLIEFLSESNAIEGVYDEQSLTNAKMAWEHLAFHDLLTSKLIREVHSILMKDQDLLPSEKGAWRNIMVYIGGRAALNAIKIPEYIDNWLLEQKTPDWKKWHVDYERIHPFVDGNGRTGRMFMNWHRLQIGLPILVIHEGDEQRDYYKWFKDIS